MERNLFLASRLREVFLNGRWIANTNFKDQLESLSWQQATTKIDKLNTIALLTFHINYYLDGILSAFTTGSLDIRDKFSFDMPAIESETEWKKLLHTFLENAEKFATYIEQLDDAAFDKYFIEEKYGNFYRNIEGVIEHSYYHLGQISLLRKLIVHS
jgi:uncharacterized damage-inducible protein DinB